MTKQRKIIKGLQDCVEYLRSIGLSVTIPTLKKYIKDGLFCWYKFGTYHFHVDNIDEWFKARTRQQVAEAPDEVENGD